MPLDISTLFLVTLLVAVWRFLRRQRRSTWTGPIQDVGSAPPDAVPIGSPRYDDNGLATFSMDLRPGRGTRRPRPGRSRPGSTEA